MLPRHRIVFAIQHNVTLEYWEEDGWLVGQLREVSSVVSQAKNLGELESNMREENGL